MANNNPPTVEFVKDALRVARANLSENDPNPVDELLYDETFVPSRVIALMEDWLRLREAVVAWDDWYNAGNCRASAQLLSDTCVKGRAALGK